jgi:NAD(P)H-dependent FMN reductase
MGARFSPKISLNAKESIMPKLLIVHHTPSPVMQQMLEKVITGAADPGLSELQIVTKAALSAGPVDVLAADGVVLGTPANIGYMSGALKHFFDVAYYPCLTECVGMPFSYYIHGDNDTSGANRAILGITKGLGWRQVSPMASVTGSVDGDDHAKLTELGATVGAYAIGAIS